MSRNLLNNNEIDHSGASFLDQASDNLTTIATMMRLGHSTARRAVTQAVYTARPTSASQLIRIGTFSTCTAHQHAKSPAVRQEQQQQSSSPSVSQSYQSFRPDPKRAPV